ncbi:MAG: hypothetical protein A2622_07970 [Bdellovibrionales bacterium RIFCSPHIGHO2_01_FULL_40_29]|nr:MAG: hypothetical protein A2622_07970 [Bdellovibrionales bacterium RIFCSPHIGHO2_01_FULL_40_29]OFZ33040.1 MAG: hypothetical protein A3D17_07945 [Bdellovibrionales bacterium RIFCSPHIGHO2_02_FULL_40_15]
MNLSKLLFRKIEKPLKHSMWLYTIFVLAAFSIVFFYSVNELQNSNIRITSDLLYRLEYESSIVYLQARLDDLSLNGRSGFKLLPSTIQVIDPHNKKIAEQFQKHIFGISKKTEVRSNIGDGYYTVRSNVFIDRIIALLIVILTASISMSRVIGKQILSALDSGTMAFRSEFNMTMIAITEAIQNSSNLSNLGLNQINDDRTIEEVQQIIDSTNKLLVQISEMHKRINKFSTQEANFQMALQLSHDVRSPLSALNLAITKITDSNSEARSIISQSSRRINEIANELLSTNKTLISEIPTYKPPLTETTEVRSVTFDIYTEKSMLWSTSKSIKLQFDCTIENEIYVTGNSNMLSRILSNLLNNAYEAMENYSGFITLGIRNYPNEVCICIMDEGKGMNSETIAMLGMQRFSSGKTNFPESGSGLGFFHAKSIVETWGGMIAVSSKLGQGTIIEIRLKKSNV